MTKNSGGVSMNQRLTEQDYDQLERILMMFLSLPADKKVIVMKKVDRMLGENNNS